MTATKTLEEVVAMLDLPSAEAVADLLREHGVKGRRLSGCGCPVAEFARALTGREAVTGGATISLRWSDGRYVGLPPSATEFIRRFDDGDPAFADLVARP